MGCADGSQRIVDIEQARDIHVEVDVDEGADDIKGGFLQFDFQVGPFEVGILFDTVGQDLAVAGLEDILGPGIVDIDDSRLVFLDVVGSGQALEELGLGGDVVFHGLVEIEVVLGQVGKDGRIVFDAGDAVQGQGMAGNFHDDMGHALFLHESQEVLEFDDIRRRVVDRQFFIVDEGVDGADDADMIACSPQDMGDDVSRRRLAVGAGDADHAHLLARIIIKERDHVFQGVMDVRYLDLDGALGQVEMFRRQDGDGTPLFRQPGLQRRRHRRGHRKCRRRDSPLQSGANPMEIPGDHRIGTAIEIINALDCLQSSPTVLVIIIGPPCDFFLYSLQAKQQ